MACATAIDTRGDPPLWWFVEMSKCDYCGAETFAAFAADWSNPDLPPVFTKPKKICLECLPRWKGQGDLGSSGIDEAAE